jgi:hypothetical protein
MRSVVIVVNIPDFGGGASLSFAGVFAGERAMKFFRSPGAAQRFLAVFSAMSPHFRPGRHKLTASDYRSEMTGRFATWHDVTGVPAA